MFFVFSRISSPNISTTIGSFNFLRQIVFMLKEYSFPNSFSELLSIYFV